MKDKGLANLGVKISSRSGALAGWRLPEDWRLAGRLTEQVQSGDAMGAARLRPDCSGSAE